MEYIQNTYKRGTYRLGGRLHSPQEGINSCSSARANLHSLGHSQLAKGADRDWMRVKYTGHLEWTSNIEKESIVPLFLHPGCFSLWRNMLPKMALKCTVCRRLDLSLGACGHLQGTYTIQAASGRHGLQGVRELRSQLMEHTHHRMRAMSRWHAKKLGLLRRHTGHRRRLETSKE